MSKTKKGILISVISFILVAVILVAGFFAIFPMNPKVEIENAEEFETHNSDILTVASYNVASPWGNLLEGTYTTRRANLFAKQINNINPDIIGIQELNSIWSEKLEKLLPQYKYYGVKRGGDETEKKSEMNGIFYLEYRYTLVDSGTFWISNTPEVESKFDGAGCNRTVSYVVLKNRANGKLVAHFNTHLDNVSEDAQNLGAELIIKKADEIKSQYNDIIVIITGDFNQYEDGVANNTLLNADFINANGSDNSPTYHGWGKEILPEPIDFIYTDSKTVSNYIVHSEKVDNSYVSDHYMITAEINLSN